VKKRERVTRSRSGHVGRPAGSTDASLRRPSRSHLISRRSVVLASVPAGFGCLVVDVLRKDLRLAQSCWKEDRIISKLQHFAVVVDWFELCEKPVGRTYPAIDPLCLG
jgi:hypothetical protein